ncbi:hypothetical protein HY497_02340 [Candidatus Woesearchaeota archaeon]|nr:hypothetical protein [Candidatus Woesearchaeota archaeon]
MIILPLEKLKEKIVNESGISAAELDQKIKEKMGELSGLISEEGAAHIVANELGMQLLESNAMPKINDLRAGMRNVDVIGKITKKFELRHFESARGPGKVASVVFGDETGVTRVVFWNDQADKLDDFHEGDVLRISSAYVRDNNGRIELHINDRSGVEVNPEGVTIDIVEKKFDEATKKSIKDLQADDANVELLVTLVDIFDPHYFTVCPECNKRAAEKEGSFSCTVHGSVTPAVSYVLNALGDDGADTIRLVFWKNQAERLLGLGNSDILTFKDYPERFQDVKHKLLGEVVKLVGRVTKNQMFDRLEFNAQLVFLNAQEAQ